MRTIANSVARTLPWELAFANIKKAARHYDVEVEEALQGLDNRTSSRTAS